MAILYDLLDYKEKIDLLESTDTSDYEKFEIIATFREDNEKIIECLKKYIKTDTERMNFLLRVSFPVFKRDILKLQALEDCIKDQECINRIVESIYNEKIKVEALEKYVDDKFPIIKGLRDEKIKVEEMRKYIKDDNQKAQILSTMFVCDERFLAKVMFEQEKISCRRLLEPNEDSVKFIRNNISRFMEIEGIVEGCEQKQELLEELYKENNEVYVQIDFRLLEKKYIDILGKEKINQISCYEDIQSQILSLTDSELRIFSTCINNYTKKAQTDEWNRIAKSILDNLITKEYEDLIIAVVDEEGIDVDKLTKILQNKNGFNIKSKEDIINYELIKEKSLNQSIHDMDIRDKISAVLEKAFGHDVQYAYNIVRKYGRDIDSLPEGDMKYYVKALKEMIDIKDGEILEEIYERCKPITFIDKEFVERELKTQYFRLYKDTLFVPTKEFEVTKDIYNAGTDFSMIVTSISAFISSDRTKSTNFKEDWNRPQISTQHFCASYIRNDMLGTAPIRTICYGFSNLSDDSLIASGPRDIFSKDNTFSSYLYGDSERYYNPDNQINMTCSYNEMDFRRIQNGMRKQPDYIVVFKDVSNSGDYMTVALKAQKDWEGLPIVIVDKEACRESEKKKVYQMIEEYKQVQTQEEKDEIRRKINIKINNNRKKNYSFCDEIDLDKIMEGYKVPNKKNISITDLETIDSDITSTDRSNMQKIFVDIVKAKVKLKEKCEKEEQKKDER